MIMTTLLAQHREVSRFVSFQVAIQRTAIPAPLSTWPGPRRASDAHVGTCKIGADACETECPPPSGGSIRDERIQTSVEVGGLSVSEFKAGV